MTWLPTRWLRKHFSIRARVASITALSVLSVHVALSFALLTMISDRVTIDAQKQVDAALSQISSAVAINAAPSGSDVPQPSVLIVMPNGKVEDIHEWGRTSASAGSKPAKDDSVALTKESGTVTAIDAKSIAPQQTATATGRVLIFLTAPVVALLAGMLAWFAAGRAMRPVAAMEREFRRLSTTELHRRVPVPGGTDAISRLACTMNSTLERLEQSVEGQQRFIAAAAHELRGPINAVRTPLEVATTYPEKADPQRAIETALIDLNHLQSVAEDLLTLARIEVSERHTEMVDVPGLAQLFHDRAAIRVDLSDADPTHVPGSEVQLHRLLRNIIDNATTHASSKVSVTVFADPDGLHIHIDDDGPGILKEARERVFDPFFRLENESAPDSEGTGLGLTIAREITQSHQGTIFMVEHPCGGTRCHIILPPALR